MKKHLILSTLCLLFFSFTMQAQDVLLLKTSGKVVIGDTSLISTPGTYNLYVQNGILTEKVKVALRDASEWSDDAFDQTPSLEEVKNSIHTNRHLPNIPSAGELVENGYELKSMDAKLLAQIEWLWQHTIKLDQENKLLRKELEAIKRKMED
ncbi:MAG: hypothetical protein AAGA77_18720 [Bacteroidota bacterium]